MVHCPWLLISFIMVFVPKCTVFPNAVQILWSSYIYFSKAVQQLKSCTTIEKSCTSLVHCPWLLISFIMVFVPKCTVFSNAVQILWSSYIYFSKAVQQLKSCTTKEKSCTSLVHCPRLLISFTMVFPPKCTVFSKAVQILLSSYIYIFKKLYNHQKAVQPKKKAVHLWYTVLGYQFHSQWCLYQNVQFFLKAVQILWSSYIFF